MENAGDGGGQRCAGNLPTAAIFSKSASLPPYDMPLSLPTLRRRGALETQYNTLPSYLRPSVLVRGGQLARSLVETGVWHKKPAEARLSAGATAGSALCFNVLGVSSDVGGQLSAARHAPT